MKIAFDFRIEWNKWFVYCWDEKHQYSIEIKQEPYEPATAVKESARLDKEQLTAFCKALETAMIESGFMQQSSATVSELKATRYHLEDMRKLTFRAEGGQ